jgi:hypothetical protein
MTAFKHLLQGFLMAAVAVSAFVGVGTILEVLSGACR